jgi:hypothetical protein
VEEKAIYELKVVQSINTSHFGQLLTYLYLLDHRRGKIINFRSATVESQFVNVPVTTAERQGFIEIDAGYLGEKRFRDSLISLLRDWGTSLSLSLYEEALISILGGNEIVEVMLPLNRNGNHLGTQRFHLAATDTAFTLTAMNKGRAAYQSQLQRLIHFSPLQAIHWFNIDVHEVTFTTISRI